MLHICVMDILCIGFIFVVVVRYLYKIQIYKCTLSVVLSQKGERDHHFE